MAALLPILTAAQIREADRLMISEKKYPGLLLMERAALAATAQILSDFPARPHLHILAGPGNNGGDGLAIARMYAQAGGQASVWLSHPPERYQGDARAQLEWARELGLTINNWNAANFFSEIDPASCLVVDALLGTGARLPLKGIILEIVNSLSQAPAEVLAIDLPTGLDADSGAVTGAVIRAARTYTFQAHKACQVVYPAAACCGKTTVLDIGIWRSVLESLGPQSFLTTGDWVRALLPPRPAHSHKGDMGKVLIAAGSYEMSGAAALTAYAALRAGAGLVTVFGPGSVRAPLLALAPEAMFVAAAQPNTFSAADKERFLTLQEAANALVIGPGTGLSDEAAQWFFSVLPHLSRPAVIDADALNLLSANKAAVAFPVPVIFTPHPGEMARLAPDLSVMTHRLETARTAAERLGAVVLLKGAHTLVASPSGEVRINTTGNPGMATAGSGDVLAGLTGALLARGLPPFDAAAAAAFFHGQAGDQAASDLGYSAMLARDLAARLRVDAPPSGK